MFGSAIMSKGKGAALQNYGNEAERAMAKTLYDDNVQVMSSFEMNKYASLTYGAQVCMDVFNLLGEILASPTDPTVLTLQKTLVLVRHLAVYGSDDAVVQANAMRHLVQRLLNFNTVLHTTAGNSLLTQIRGGAVDYGAPVREAAQNLDRLLHDPASLQRIRSRQADPNSLVPVGNQHDALFQSTEHALEMERRGGAHVNRTKSNLVKQASGFGSGYNAKGGQTVVGAAHSIEEMLAVANKEKMRYVDDVNDPKYRQRQAELEKVRANLEEVKKEEAKQRQERALQVDLLDFGGGNGGDGNTTDNYGQQHQQQPPPRQQQAAFDIFDTPMTSINNNAGNSSGSGTFDDDLIGLSTNVLNSLEVLKSAVRDTINNTSLLPVEDTNITYNNTYDSNNTNINNSTFGTNMMGGALSPDLFSTAHLTGNGQRPSLNTVNIMGGGSSSRDVQQKKSVMGGGTCSSSNFSALDLLATTTTTSDTQSSVFDTQPLAEALPSVSPPPLPSEPPPPPPMDAPPPVPTDDVYDGGGFQSYEDSIDMRSGYLMGGGMGSSSNNVMGGAAPPMGARGLMGSGVSVLPGAAVDNEIHSANTNVNNTGMLALDGLTSTPLHAGISSSAVTNFENTNVDNTLLPTTVSAPLPAFNNGNSTVSSNHTTSNNNMYGNDMMSMMMNAPSPSMPQEQQQAAPTVPSNPMPTAAGTNPIMMNPTMMNPMMMQQQMMMMQANMTPEQQQQLLQQQMMMMQTMMMGMNNNNSGGNNNNNNNSGGGPNNNSNNQNNANHNFGGM